MSVLPLIVEKQTSWYFFLFSDKICKNFKKYVLESLLEAVCVSLLKDVCDDQKVRIDCDYSLA